MVGFPYDDLDGWRGPYPPDIFISQFEKVADGFEAATTALRASFNGLRAELKPAHAENMAGELNVAEAAAIHFRSTANQARFVRARQTLAAQKSGPSSQKLVAELEAVVRSELDLARRLHAIQSRDSRIGFEATNHYYYVPLDLAEKVLNCRELLDGWLARERLAAQ